MKFPGRDRLGSNVISELSEIYKLFCFNLLLPNRYDDLYVTATRKCSYTIVSKNMYASTCLLIRKILQ